MNVKPIRGNSVKWTSRMSEHVFRGRVVKVLGDAAVIDDGLGLTYRCVPLAVLTVIGGGGRQRFAGHAA